MPHTGATFVDVKQGEKLSAENMNGVHAAVRQLLQVHPNARTFLLEPARIDPADVTASRPNRNDGVIGTVTVSEGVVTAHFIELDGSSRKVKELSTEMKKNFSNVGQKYFSRDEVFLIAEVNGSYVPIKIGGSEAVLGVTTSTVSAASYGTGEITPGFGTMNVYDWNAEGTKLVATSIARVANIASSSIASNRKIMARMVGKVYVADWELCT